PADTKAAPTTGDKKPETPAKPADTKAAPTTGDKKPEVPAKPADTKAAPAAGDKKPEVPAKPADTKTAPTAGDKKPENPARPADTKAAPTAGDKKPENPAKPADTKAAPTAGDKKPEVPAKPADTKAAPAAGDKKPEDLAKPADSKADPAASDKKPENPAKLADTKAAPAAGDKKAEAPAAGPGKATAVEPPKGIRVTQVYGDRLKKPDEAALKALPVPQENEGYSMRLHPGYFFEFLDHPFTVNREVQDYKDLYESIKENGINEPVKARPREGGGLELLSGHRRHDIAKQLNYPVPVVIVRADDDTARIEVVDGNLHRQDIPTSELARAAKMKMEALARKAGRRSKMDQLAGPQKRTDQQVAEDMGISRNQVQRLIHIDSLIPDLKQQVDDKKLPFNTAVELSFLKPEEQNKVVEFMEKEGTTPSMAQATELKKASQEAAKAAPPPEKKDTPKTPAPVSAAAPKSETKPAKAPAQLDEKKISSIVKPKAEPEMKYTFTAGELKEFFPNDKAPTVSEVKRTVFEALDMRQKAIARQKAKQAAKGSIMVP
ncbi:ParB/RepB/Spo0J family partition protein, partial [Acutalibacter muris]